MGSRSIPKKRRSQKSETNPSLKFKSLLNKFQFIARFCFVFCLNAQI
jgi:hypothetical protein